MIEAIIASATTIVLAIAGAALLLIRKLGHVEQHLISHDGQFVEVKGRLCRAEGKTNEHIHDHLTGG